MRLLYIEDDRELAAIVSEDLEEHYSVDVAYTGSKGWSLIRQHEYNLVIIDYMLPDFDGLELCQRIRGAGLTVPILILTGENDVETKVRALEAGADDYLTKPFAFIELLARSRALLRRPPVFVSSTLSVNDLTLDLTNQLVMRNNYVIPLRQKEFRILEYLMRNVGRILTKRMILEHVWNGRFEPETNVVEVNINALRERIDKPFKKQLIYTIHGLGYKIQAKKEKGGDSHERTGKKSLNKQRSKK